MASAGAGVTPEEQAMAIAEDVLARLPAKILTGPSHEGDIKPADMTPMSIVVIQEAARYERLVNVVRSSSRAVIGAVQGIDEKLLSVSLSLHVLEISWLYKTKKLSFFVL